VSSFPRNGHTYGLYAQCEYLLSNPTIAAHVQALSVDLYFEGAPSDLMKKFVETLLRLPNLRTLELMSVSRRGPVTARLKRKNAKFPNIREVVVDYMYPDFIRSCPNIESLTFRSGSGLGSRSSAAIRSYGAGLKRVAGVDFGLPDAVRFVVQGCPKLQEIGLFGDAYFGSNRVFQHLRRAKHLSVVEIDLVEEQEDLPRGPQYLLGDTRKAWMRGLLDVLKDSPSKDRKFLRWKVIGTWSVYDHPRIRVLESGELEVLPETFL